MYYIRPRLFFFFRHLFLFAVVADINLERRGAFRYLVFAASFVLARFGVRRRLNKTFNIYRRLFTFAVGIYIFSFASRRRRRFCFVRHLLNLGDNTLLQIN